jgi:hypothetical protein
MHRRITCAVALAAMALLLAACAAGSKGAVRTTVEDAAKAVEQDLNRRNLNSVRLFFATAGEGANAAGLADTWGALETFAAGLTPSERVQFHSFDIEDIAVHEGGDLARASYRLHVSVLRGSEVAFGLVATQNLALLRTERGWRISGGDEAQISEVIGRWPLFGSPAAAH